MMNAARELVLRQGCPENVKEVPTLIRQWHPHRHDLFEKRGLLVKVNCIIIPCALHREILEKIHDGHTGITRCTQRVRKAVFWPGINSDINRLIERCETCIHNQGEKKLRIITSETPEGLWQKVAVDFVEFKNSRYLVYIGYYFCFINCSRYYSSILELIARSRDTFARHGILHEIVSDSGTKFTGE